MNTFTLDTSGAVAYRASNEAGQTFCSTLWTDLDAFTQDYIEALARDGAFVAIDHATGLPIRRPFAFSDLAPETLARIIADCAAWSARNPGKSGQFFWETRQAGERGAWKPLTPHLGDDSKVYLREQV